jgi:hypothetical protein
MNETPDTVIDATLDELRRADLPQDTVAEEFFRAHGARRIVGHNAIRQPSR